MPGLDGLRAVSVGAVFLFHARVVDGGFIGVDVFFVISGFLITALAVDEIDRTGRLAPAKFWGRRVRRLLPAMYLMCAAVVVWAALNPPAPRNFSRDVVSTLTYVANWTRIRDGDEYFAAYDEPSPLEHTWSLAVEEQFYVVWPLVIIVAVVASRRTRWSARATIGVVAALGAVGSAVWAWWLAAQPDVQLDRLYFGTGTRGVGLAVGCVAGCALARGARTGNRRIGPLQTGVAGVGVAVLLALMLLIDGSERWLYGTGFAVIALASLAVVNAASGDGPVGRVLGVRPLAGIGRLSYGIYLWHWPVIVVLDEDRTGLGGPALGALWVAATAILVTASWFVVERRAPLPVLDRPGIAAGYVLVGMAIAVASIAIANLDRAGTGRSEVTAPPPVTIPIDEPAEPGPSALEDVTSDVIDSPDLPEPGAQPVSTTEAPLSRPVRLLVLGDSVAESLGAGPGVPIEADGVEVEVTNRSIVACPVLWQGRWAYDDGRLLEGPVECQGEDRFSDTVAEVEPDVVLLMFGWPGTISGWQFEDGTIVAPCEPGFDEAFGDEYDQLVRRLESTAQGVVATVAPPSEYRDPAQSDRPGCINRELRDRGFTIFDFGEWLCPDGDCAPAAELRRDTIHFANSPSVLDAVWPAILAQTMTSAGY